MSEYQGQATETDQTPAREAGEEKAILVPLLGLAGEAGQLLSEYKKRLRDGSRHEQFSTRVAEELGDILWYTANLATKYGLDLNVIAEQNLLKTRARYRVIVDQPADLDSPYAENERFPRRFDVALVEHKEGEHCSVQLLYRGKNIGALLTDNSYLDDGYRFHDVFHVAYAAILGWSPVLRANMNLKRRSSPKTDEVEDGGRAAVIEEGIIALAFDYARKHAFLEEVNDIDGELLATIKSMSHHLEVSSCDTSSWRTAILEGFKVWRSVVRNRGGVIRADLDARSVSYLGPIDSATTTAPAEPAV